MKFIFFRASLITCDAIHICKLISKISPKSNPKIINFGIDTSFFVSKLQSNIKVNSINIISTRNHEEIYNLETLINTAKDLQIFTNIPFPIGFNNIE